MLKKVLLVIVIVLVGIQFIGVEKNDAATPEVDLFLAETKPSKEVQTILEAKCFDCHSNKTAYPWYSKIAPVSFWIGHHVEEGKEHLDFSNWANYDAKKKKHKLHEVEEEVEEDKMPLESYEKLHGDLTETEKEALIAWAKQAMASYKK
ncbi:heme-binding domain-containing protein [Wenyingzhuangia sp. IMCC45574]